jgi:hypothetical protein
VTVLDVNVGSMVLVLKPKRKSKTETPWDGPFKVTEIYPNSVTLVDVRSGDVMKKVAMRRITNYVERCLCMVV